MYVLVSHYKRALKYNRYFSKSDQSSSSTHTLTRFAALVRLELHMTKPVRSVTTRFSSRVQNYTQYRPSYPQSAIQWIVDRYQLGAHTQVADIGSGTGIFTQALMKAGLQVMAIEPNLDMRLESDRLHANNALYSSHEGTAERTMLEDNSVDVIAAAQAGHWFDVEKSKCEFQRVLKPNGVLALVWNRRERHSDFQAAYENVLEKLPEYNKVKHSNLDDQHIAAFFTGKMERKCFANSQEFDLASFKGRVFSSSYTPGPEDSGYEAFNQRLEALFSDYSVGDKVRFTYTTEVYSGYME